jgi:beta-glucosidase-like glycosyl hydrolase
VLKHFPGLGQTTTDLHFGYQSINPDQSELNVFRAVVDGYPNIGIMSSFVGVTAQNPRLPCALSPDCVGQLTTEYPSALLFTDALEMVAAGYQAGSASATLSERSERAIKAGNHVLIFGDSVSGDDFSEILDDLENLLVTDPEFATLVEKQAKHVLEYKQTKGLL